jgi:hypothetical protein
VISVISPGSTKQLVVAELFCVACLILYGALKPFDDAELAMTSTICQLQVWYILFISILIKENVAISSTFIEVSVVFAILFVVVYDCFWSIVEFCPLPKKVDSFINHFTLSKTYIAEKSHKEVINDAVDKTICLLSIPDDTADDDESSRRGDTKECCALRIGKMKNQISILQKKSKSTEKNQQQVKKLELALDSRQQGISDEISRVWALIEAEKGGIGGGGTGDFGSFVSLNSKKYLEVSEDEEEGEYGVESSYHEGGGAQLAMVVLSAQEEEEDDDDKINL